MKATRSKRWKVAMTAAGGAIVVVVVAVIAGVKMFQFDAMAKDGALTLHFVLPVKAPVTPKQLALEVFDPSYFIDFKFDDKDPIRLVGAPAACQMRFQRPNDDTANAQRLNEQNFMNGDNSNYGAMFAKKITVNCP